ncbi:hypothetical protein [Nonomuraea dietziae]|uniref:hypothetical protein n=1 Tax=Nonomuraea dietziae TaxID=65515 RepID=UPI0034259160
MTADERFAFTPGVVAVEAVLAATPALTILLPHLHVYPGGMLLTLQALGRRIAMTNPDQWRLVTSTFLGLPHDLQGQVQEEDLLQIGIRSPSCTWWENDPGLLAPRRVCVDQTEFDDRLTGAITAWIGRLPPPPTFEVLLRWPLAGITDAVIRIESAVVAEAARRSRLLWDAT